VAAVIASCAATRPFLGGFVQGWFGLVCALEKTAAQVEKNPTALAIFLPNARICVHPLCSVAAGGGGGA
jgi:hypothetical protein